jgi:hypothetical protein
MVLRDPVSLSPKRPFLAHFLPRKQALLRWEMMLQVKWVEGVRRGDGFGCLVGKKKCADHGRQDWQ